MSNPICRGTARPPPKTSQAQRSKNYQQYDMSTAGSLDIFRHGPNCNCPLCAMKKPPKTSLSPICCKVSNGSGIDDSWNVAMPRSNCETLENQNGCERSQEIDRLDPGRAGGWGKLGKYIVGGIGRGIGSAAEGIIGGVIGGMWVGQNSSRSHGHNCLDETDQENCQEICQEVVECQPICLKHDSEGVNGFRNDNT